MVNIFEFIWLVIFIVLVKDTRSEIYYSPNETQVDNSAITVDASTNTLKDIGVCFCNLYINVCEYQCCCDTDCDQIQINAWSMNGKCLTKYLTQKCIKNYLLSSINQKRGMSVYYNKVQNLTCVQSDTQTIFTQFFTQVTTIPDETVLSYYKNISADAGIQYPQKGDPILSLLTPYKGYTMQQQIRSAYLDFSVYYPDSFGFCRKFQSVKFLQEVKKAQCSIKYNMSTDCAVGGNLDLNKYLLTSLVLQSQLNSQSTVSLQITDILYFNKQITDTNYTASASPVINKKTSTVTTQCTCNNIINGIRYILTYDETQFKLTKITAHVYTSSGLIAQCLSVGFSTLFTEVIFVNSQGTFFDGKPGYTQKDRIYAGIRIANQTSFDTLSVLLSNGVIKGNCQIGPSVLQSSLLDPMNSNYLRFGQKMQLSCSTQWKKVDFASNCNQTYLDSLLIFKNIPYKDTTTYLSRTVYSNRQYQDDWVEVKQLSLTQNITYNATTLTCTLPVQQNLQIFYDQAGLDKNGQTYIKEAFIGYSQFKTITIPTNASNTDTTTVTFVMDVNFYNQVVGEIEDLMPQHPSFIPQLPVDIFFPVWYESSCYRIGVIIMILLVI